VLYLEPGSSASLSLEAHPCRTPTPAQEQTDVHVPEATVLEALRFSARLRLPSNTPDAVVTKFVDEVGVWRAADLKWVLDYCCHQLAFVVTADVPP
jgi:hypothetical protein